MNEESSALARRACEGDDGARDELARRHYGRLRLYVRARLGAALGRRVDAEDIVQECFLRAFRDLARFEPNDPGAFHRWLTAIARHAIADAARAARAHADRAALPLVESGGRGSDARERSLAASTMGPATRALLDERQRSLEAAFARLSPQHRRVIALRQFEGLSAREVAARLQSTEGAVHALFRRALQAWAEVLGPGAGAGSG